MQKENMRWICCPICGGKTRDRIREDTVIEKLPSLRPEVKTGTLIEVKNLQVTVIKEPDA